MKITALGFLFKCCCHLQTSFTGVIWQKKWLYYATGGQTGTDGRSLSRTHFCSCEENIPGARSHGTWKRLPASGGWAPTLGQGWSNCLQKKNLCQVEDWMSLFPRHPPSSILHDPSWIILCDPVTWGLFGEQIFIEPLQCDTHQVLNPSCTSLQVFSDSPLVPATAVAPCSLQASPNSVQRQPG